MQLAWANYNRKQGITNYSGFQVVIKHTEIEVWIDDLDK